jgi:hypothetical protein
MKQEVRNMCKQAVVLDTIKNTAKKGGMTAAQLKLAEAQSEDYAEMKREIQELKTEVYDVRKDVSSVKIQLAEIKGGIDILLESNKIKSKLIDSKYFWIALIVLMMLIAGVNHLAELKTIFGG